MTRYELGRVVLISVLTALILTLASAMLKLEPVSSTLISSFIGLNLGTFVYFLH